MGLCARISGGAGPGSCASIVRARVWCGGCYCRVALSLCGIGGVVTIADSCECHDMWFWGVIQPSGHGCAGRNGKTAVFAVPSQPGAMSGFMSVREIGGIARVADSCECHDARFCGEIGLSWHGRAGRKCKKPDNHVSSRDCLILKDEKVRRMEQRGFAPHAGRVSARGRPCGLSNAGGQVLKKLFLAGDLGSEGCDWPSWPLGPSGLSVIV